MNFQQKTATTVQRTHDNLRRRNAALALGCLAFALISFTFAAKLHAQLPDQMAKNRTLVFDDEFDQLSPNSNKWALCYWWNDGGCTNLGNKELEWYSTGNVELHDGILNLIARRESARGYKGRMFGFTSGMVTTGRYQSERGRRSRFAFKYGYVEVRAKVPAGKGLWPAIWLLPSNEKSLPEIDMMEVFGNSTNRLRLHLHYLAPDGTQHVPEKIVTVQKLDEDFHTYGLDWTSSALVWFLDGRPVWRYSKPAGIPDLPMYLLMNLAVGGDSAGNPSNQTQFPSTFAVDYVRIWQSNDQAN
jgi:beta-glucanase (GH16 family)